MKLADIIEEWISGDWGNEQSSTEAQEKVYCLRSADISPIYHSTFDTAAIRYISAHSLSQNQLKEGDIVIEKSGGTNSCSTGRVILITKDILAKNTPLVCSNFCAAFRVKENWDSAFVYYYFRLIHRSGVFLNFEGKTSGIHNLLIDTAFATIDFPDVDLSTQKRIASILSNIDRKIALNRAMNEELKQTARDLYDYWFLQFDFPDANGKPYRSSGGKMVYNPQLKREIPQGWEVGNICKVADILSGGTPSKSQPQFWNGNILFFGPTDYKNQMFQLNTKDRITEVGLNKCASSLYEEGVIIITARGSIGKLVICGRPMAMNQSCYALRSLKGEYQYLYFLSQDLIKYLKVKGSGSTFDSIISSDIKASYFPIPYPNLITEFCKIVAPWFGHIKNNSVEIDHLRSLRDELLPLLMNGQVKVKE